MKKINQHILSSINFELNTRNKELAYGLKDSVGAFIHDELMPDLERLFDELGPQNQVCRFDSIDVELEVRSLENLSELKGVILSGVKERLESSPAEYFKIDNFETGRLQSSFKGIDQPESFAGINAKMRGVGEEDWSIGNSLLKNNLEVTDSESFLLNELSNLENIFIYFLEKGLLPWYANRYHFERFKEPEIFQEAFKNEWFVNRLKSVLVKNRHSFYRFVKQCDEKLAIQFIELVLKEKQCEPGPILHRLKMFNRWQRIEMMLFILACLLETDGTLIEFHYQKLVHELKKNQMPSEEEKKQFEFVKQVIDSVKPATLVFGKLLTENESSVLSAESKMIEFQDKEGKLTENHSPELLNEIFPEVSGNLENNVREYPPIFVRNAGLVVAHPFIWNLFENTGCADRKSLFPEKISRAVHLLRFLAVGDENIPEFELVLEKFLCGLPPEYPLDRDVELSVQEKMECDELLRSMITNWPELKNSSPDTLRQMFLQRDGKLDFTRKPCKLFVERKAQDVLLGKLQWNISIVKLPSMSEVLFIEW